MAKRKSYDADGNPVNPTLLGRIKSGGVSWLSGAANAIDLVGSSVRDVLVGRNPLDQWSSPFHDANRTSEGDLLRHYKLIGKKDTWSNLPARIATGLVTDPLTYLTFGGSALGKAGKLAKLAGLTDDVTRVAAKVAGKPAGSVGKATARLTVTPAHLIAHGAPDALEKLTQAATKQGIRLSDVMHEPLGGLSKFWPTGSVLGTGETARKVAGVMDKAGEAVRFGKYSPVAPLARLFDAPSKDAKTAVQAATGRRAYQLEEAARATARGHIAEFTNGLMKAGHATEADAPLIREVLEGVKPLSAVNPALHPHIANFKQKIAAVPGEAAAVGRKVRIYDDPQAAFIPRRKTDAGIGSPSGGKYLGTQTASQLARKPFFFGIKGGTEAINRIGRSVAPLVASKASIKDIAKHLRKNFKGVIPKTFLSNKDRAATLAAQAAGKVAPQVKQFKTFRHIAKNMLGHDPALLKQGLFGNHPVADVHSMLTAEGVANARAKAVIEAMEQPGALLSKPQAGSVPVKKVLKDLGMDVKSPAVQHLLKQHLPGETAGFLANMDKGFEVPHAVADTLGKIDWITNLTKLGLTSPWLNFQVRNRVSGVFNNFLAGMFSRPAENAAHTLYTGGVVKGAAQIPEVARVAASQGIAHLDDKTATDILRQLSFAHEVASKHEGAALQSAGGLPTKKLQDIIGEMPGSTPNNPLTDIPAIYAGKNGATWNPLKGKIRGVAGAEQSTFAPLAGGEAVGHYMESMNRLAPWIHRMQEGATAAQAAKEVGEAQVKYASRHYTKFEQQFLARLFPFMKFCVPDDHEILTRRGWLTVDQVTTEDDALTYNMENGKLEWQRVEAVNVFQHSGLLNQFKMRRKTRDITFQYTDDHRWPVKTTLIRVLAGDDGLRRSRKVKSSPRFKLGSELRHDYELLIRGDYQGKRSILSPRHAAILGWVVTDGYHRWTSTNGRTEPGVGSCEMLVYQSTKKFLEEIIGLLGTNPRTVHPLTGVVPVPVAREDINAIVKVFKRKADLPYIVGRLSREAAEAMWDTMFMAEGCTQKKTGLQYFSQKSSQDVLDAFQILCLLTGRSANLKCDGCVIKKGGGYSIRRQTQSRIFYRGRVWCPTTANGTWVMRHDGAVVITGNSRGMIPFMGKQLAERPGGKLAQTLRGVNKGHTQEEGLPEHITETAAIPLPAGKSGDARFLTGLGLAFEDPAQLITPDLKAAGNELLSRTNPLLKGTLEAITGRSFFQRGPGGEGRPLSDMDPGIGRTLANIGNLTGLRKSNEPVRFPGSGLVEGIAANSPLSKAVQTLRTATDTRKGIGSKAANLLTGLRITDVSPQQRETVLRRQADDLLRALGGRKYTESYFPKDKLASLPPSERQIVQDLLDFRLSLDKKRKAQKKQLAKR